MKMLRLATAYACAAVLLGGLCAGTAKANSKRVLLCFPGGPGSTEQAQPVVDEFLGHLSALAGWSAVEGGYFTTAAACRSAMNAAKPDVMMVPLDVYLEKREAWKLVATASLKNKNTAGAYHVVSTPGTTMDDLRGAVVLTGLKESDAFLSKVAFGGELTFGQSFLLERTRSPRKAIKAVVKGKAKGTILNDVQFKALKGSKKFSSLVSLKSGPELPGAIVARVGSAAPALEKAILAVCKKHSEACKRMQITGFLAVDGDRLLTYEKMLKQ